MDVTAFFFGDMGKLIALLAVLVVGIGIWFALSGPSEPKKIPTFDPEEWWGPKELKGRVDKTIKPFKVKFDEEMIKDLRQRLKNPRPVLPPLEDVAFEYGFNTKYLNTWTSYWADKYDFAAREKFFNQYEHFTTYIQGLNVHFIRVKPQVPAGVKVVPLLLIHGWPGSVREFYEMIPLLTKQTAGYDFVFELIIPSLPGYGYTDAAARVGLAMPQTAVIFRNLMHRLGHKKFYVQGGDWGSGVGSTLATLFPEDILGYHSNLLMAATNAGSMMYFFGAYFPSFVVESKYADRMYPIAAHFAYMMEEFGYFHIQATKPDTVGVALTDSPTGLLAYILEKFAVWTHKDNKLKEDGNLEARYSKDQLLDNLMLYWAPNKITSSMRYYAENFSNKNRELDLDNIQTSVPTWGFQAKHEITYRSPRILRTKYTNLIDVTVSDEGGHFLALELPAALAADVFKAVKAFREFHVNNKTEL